ncbi:synaptotagmin-17 [Crotalus adamanteus]|uniref:Synaptotagmin-17 n=1 Tax=Crotalus adamanteus TaxID=8729 RepID=A0AAW1AUT4_CROAD
MQVGLNGGGGGRKANGEEKGKELETPPPSRLPLLGTEQRREEERGGEKAEALGGFPRPSRFRSNGARRAKGTLVGRWVEGACPDIRLAKEGVRKEGEVGHPSDCRCVYNARRWLLTFPGQMGVGLRAKARGVRQLEPINEGLLSRISDLLLCRWTCRNCCQKCYECSCCPSNEDEVEILGPFPAQTPPWLLSNRSEDKNGNTDNATGEPSPIPQNVSLDRRRSSTDTSRSTYSLTRRISSLELRRPSSPLVDIKPIEFGILGSKKEIVQPSILRKTYTPDEYFRKFEPGLYSLDSNSDDLDSLTDEEILAKYQLGKLHFSTQYDLLHNYLIVRVIEAKDLPPPISYDGARQDMAHSNPYVKICLLPDQKNSKQTGVKRKTQNPIFEERYMFDILFLEAQRRTLLLTVVDFDKFSRHCVIGKVSMPLSEVDLVKGGHWWKALVPSSQNEVELGELLLSLNYLPSAGRLNVDIIRAKQLLQTDMSQGSDPFVKIQLVHGLKLAKTKKTSCMKATIDPFYNESFSFKVAQEELENTSLVFTVYGHNVKSSNDFIGRIVIGQYSTGSSESKHWRRMLTSHRTAIEQWHSLRSRAECDRVSPASLEVT